MTAPKSKTKPAQPGDVVECEGGKFTVHYRRGGNHYAASVVQRTGRTVSIGVFRSEESARLALSSYVDPEPPNMTATVRWFHGARLNDTTGLNAKDA